MIQIFCLLFSLITLFFNPAQSLAIGTAVLYKTKVKCPKSTSAVAKNLENLNAFLDTIKTSYQCDSTSLSQRIRELSALAEAQQPALIEILKQKTTLAPKQAALVKSYVASVSEIAAGLFSNVSQKNVGTLFRRNHCQLTKENRTQMYSNLAAIVSHISGMVGQLAGPYGIPISLSGAALGGVLEGIVLSKENNNTYKFEKMENRKFFESSLCIYGLYKDQAKKITNPETTLDTLANVQNYNLELLTEQFKLCTQNGECTLAEDNLVRLLTGESIDITLPLPDQTTFSRTMNLHQYLDHFSPLTQLGQPDQFKSHSGLSFQVFKSLLAFSWVESQTHLYRVQSSATQGPQVADLSDKLVDLQQHFLDSANKYLLQILKITEKNKSDLDRLAKRLTALIPYRHLENKLSDATKAYYREKNVSENFNSDSRRIFLKAFSPINWVAEEITKLSPPYDPRMFSLFSDVAASFASYRDRIISFHEYCAYLKKHELYSTPLSQSPKYRQSTFALCEGKNFQFNIKYHNTNLAYTALALNRLSKAIPYQDSPLSITDLHADRFSDFLREQETNSIRSNNRGSNTSPQLILDRYQQHSLESTMSISLFRDKTDSVPSEDHQAQSYLTETIERQIAPRTLAQLGQPQPTSPSMMSKSLNSPPFLNDSGVQLFESSPQNTAPSPKLSSWIDQVSMEIEIRRNLLRSNSQ